MTPVSSGMNSKWITKIVKKSTTFIVPYLHNCLIVYNLIFLYLFTKQTINPILLQLVMAELTINVTMLHVHEQKHNIHVGTVTYNYL